MYSSFKSALQRGFFGSNRKAADAAIVKSGELMRPEGMRQYLIAEPSQKPTGKRPLVIILHGGGASAAQVLGLAFPASPLSVWLQIAEREQLVIVAPNGSRRGWNDSFADVASTPKTDDTGFISALIAKTIAENEVDAARVYVIGVSRGGMMAYRLATEIAPQLAAFSAVLANMPIKSVCAAPTVPLSALIVASTADPLIPYKGGRFFYVPGVGPMKSVDESVTVWRSLAKLDIAAKVTTIAHRNAGDPTQATRFVWGGDTHKLQVALLKVDGAGHTEPSQTMRYPWLITRLVGAQNADFEVAEEAWVFFKDKRSGLLT